MKRTNASVFIPHLGCPHECSFCNKDAITEAEKSITITNVTDVLENHARSLRRRNMTAEIAFFGGTFTALEPDYRVGLLKTANEFITLYPELFVGIRCSTRPDYINEEVLRQLREYNVNAIELGAQSLDNEVLEANNRGHTADDVRAAAKLIKAQGFELGLQMMTGLYKDSAAKSLYTCDELIKLKPDTVRIYPTVIFKGTQLAKIPRRDYKPFTEEETIALCAEIYARFVQNNVRVIRIGLNYPGNVIGELSISRYYYNKMLDFMSKSNGTKFKVFTDKHNISKINGHKCENKHKLEKLGFMYKIKEKQNTELEIHVL
ncbi:MAG: radical SAM protein [Oscillospiraceae bacterium]|nr:radical SAM protein [Oscillospiraceae bacterium]